MLGGEIMGSVRLRKADRIKLAGQGNNKAQYTWGSRKRSDKVFGRGTIDSVAKKRGSL